MEQVLSKNVGALITTRNASTELAWTAGGAGDNTTKTGVVIDREAIGSPGNGAPPLSAQLAVLYEATLASGNTLTIAIGLDHSSNNSDWVEYASTAATTTATGTSGGAAQTSQMVFNVNLSSARRWIRPKFLPDLSAAGTDTAKAVAVAVLAGYDRLAAPA